MCSVQFRHSPHIIVYFNCTAYSVKGEKGSVYIVRFVVDIVQFAV